jgi:putative DNA methylase
LISTSLEFNSLLCGYKGAGIRRPGAIRHVFSHHAYSFPYTALENNPVLSARRSGTLKRLFHDRILKAGRWAVEPVERLITADGRQQKVPIRGEIDSGEPVADWESLAEGNQRFLVLQADSATLEIPEGIVDFVVTDPPYYDSVQYSDLSNFFRVWLRLLLPKEADWRYDPLDSAVSEGNISGRHKYGKVLGEIWKACYQALDKDRGRLIFTFHHWNHEAWAELTASLKSAGFVLANRYVVFSENPISVHIRDLKALKHDTILVLKPDVDATASNRWLEPTRIDTSDSYAFCRDCGAALGWFLSTDLTEADIRRGWKHLLEGENNGDGKASI